MHKHESNHTKTRERKKQKKQKNNSCEHFGSPDTGMSTATPRAALPSLTSVQVQCVWGDGEKECARVSMWCFRVYEGTITVAPVRLAVQTMYLCLNWWDLSRHRRHNNGSCHCLPFIQFLDCFVRIFVCFFVCFCSAWGETWIFMASENLGFV